MTFETVALIFSAGSVGFLHTIFGPDHYLPLVALAKVHRWSTAKAVLITSLYGMVHVLSAVLIGMGGLYLGANVFHLSALESLRAEMVAWAFILIGLTYFIWGLRKARRNQGLNAEPARGGSWFATILLAAFIVGPCEPLIPLLILPAIQKSFSSLIVLVTIFGGVTIVTMMGLVLVLLKGSALIRFPQATRYAHAMAGATILICGVFMKMGF